MPGRMATAIARPIIITVKMVRRYLRYASLFALVPDGPAHETCGYGYHHTPHECLIAQK